MKNYPFPIFLICLFILFTTTIFSNNTIRFYTTEQQYGVADLDYFELATDTLAGGMIYEAEYPSASTVGFSIPRGEASNDLVWGQLGATDGSVQYNDIPGNGPFYIRLIYSRYNPQVSAPPVELYVNDTLQGTWLLQETGSWNLFDTTAWLPISLFTAISDEHFYHPFQNFDDDVDRIKRFSNFFTGSSGIIGNTTLLTLNYNSNVTRTGYGKSLEIQYDSLIGFASYAESFQRNWYDNGAPFDLNNLFPDFLGDDFENRQMDSLVFYCRLDAAEPLRMKLELSDTENHKGNFIVDLLPSTTWHRIAVAICDFEMPPNAVIPFDPAKAKFLGFTFEDGFPSVNLHESGTLYLDDIYLVENGFSKPQFQNEDDLLAYLNKVRFRFFWEAVDPISSLIFDRHLWDTLISVDGIGWQLSTYTIAHRNQWISPPLIEERTEQILYNLLYRCEHTNDPALAIANPLKYASVKGSWAHFLSSGDLKRKDTRTEYSLFTNALLLSGVMVARQYFSGNSSIVAKADSIIAMTDWNFLYDTSDRLMHFHWTPEEGLSSNKTDWFSEELDLAFLLGISSPVAANRLPENPYFSNGYRRPFCEEGDFIFSAPGTGFTYWFLQMYARFETNTQRFQNTRNAVLKELEIDHNSLGDFSTFYDPRIFGSTACEGADSAGFYLDGLDTVFISNYHAYGYCCKFDTNNDLNGTIAPYGGISTILFTPDEALDLVKYYYNDLDSIFTNEYQYAFWSPIFGFPDAFHLDPDGSNDTLINLGFNGPWLSVPRFAIDMGPMLINTDSYLAEKGYYAAPSVRDLFSSYPPVEAQLPLFDTIDIHEMPEVVEISPDTCLAGATDIEYIASVFNAGHFAYAYNWWYNGNLYATTVDSFLTINTAELETGDSIFCQLSIPMENCDFSLTTSSNAIEICVDPVSTHTPSFLQKMEIMPNPVSHTLLVNVELANREEATIRLDNLLGQTLFEQNYKHRSFSASIDCSRLPAGIYLLTLMLGEKSISRKIVKQGEL